MISLILAIKSVFRRPKQNIAVIVGIALGVSLFVGVQVGTDSLSSGFVTFVEHGLGELDAHVVPSSTSFFVTPNVLAEEGDGVLQSNFFDQLNAPGSHTQYIAAMAPRVQITFTVLDEVTGSIEVGKRLSGIGTENEFGRLLNSDGDELKTSDLAGGEVYIGEETGRLLFKDDPIGKNLTLSTSLFTLPDFANDSYAEPIPFRLNVKIADIFVDKEKGRENFADFLVTDITWLQNQVFKSYETAKINSANTIFGFGSEPITDIILAWNDNVDTGEKTEEAAEAVAIRIREIVGDDLATLYTVVNTRTIILTAIKAAVEGIELLLNVFASLIIVAGVLVIINIQNMALAAREKETGILRAIGSKRGQIIMSNLWEAVFLGVLGSGLGLFGGALYGRLLVIFMGIAFEFPTGDIPVIITTSAITTSLVSGIMISLFTGIIPSIMASQVNVAQVLRGLKPPATEKFGKLSLYTGIIITSINLVSLLQLNPNPLIDGTDAFKDLEDTEAIFIPVTYFILGISLLLTYNKSKKFGLTFFSIAILAWAYYNIFVVFDIIETGNGGLLYILLLIMSLVTGSILLFGMNLSVVAKIGEGFIALLVRNRNSSLRGTSMVAFRKMTSQATRSTLTFALFATILTLNIFIATWSYSFRYGFDSVVIELSGNTDFMLDSQPIPDTVDFSQELIDEFANTEVRVKYVRPFTKSINQIGYLNHTGPDVVISTNLVTMGVGTFWSDPTDDTSEWIIKLNLRDNKTGTPFEVYEDEDDDLPQTFEDENVWRALLRNETLENKENQPLPIIITTLIGELTPSSFDQTHFPGDSIFLNLTDGRLQEFVIGSIAASNPIIDSADSGNGPPGLFQTWFVNQFWSQKLFGFIGYSGHSNLFLGKTTIEDITSDLVEDFIRDVEIWANQQDGEFRQNHGIYAVIGTTVYSIYEAILENNYRFFLFLQAFVSLGFVVGILGLLVVASRSVAERTREIGMLRALGFKRADVVVAVVLELVVMGVIGLVIGLINGSVMGYALTNINSGGDATFLIPWSLIGLYTFITLFSAIIAAIFPAIKASKIPPSDALRYTG